MQPYGKRSKRGKEKDNTSRAREKNRDKLFFTCKESIEDHQSQGGRINRALLVDAVKFMADSKMLFEDRIKVIEELQGVFGK